MRKSIKIYRGRALARRRMRRIKRGLVGYKKYKPSTYDFKRKQFYQNAISLTTAGTDYSEAWAFQLALLPNASDFTNLYDEYMIKKIVYKIIPKFTQAGLIPGGDTDDMPQIHSALDFDDSTPPASIQALCEYQSHKMTRGNQIHTRVLVPRVELAGTSPATTQAPKAFQWLDSDVTNTDHRGIKVYIPKPQTGSTQISYDVMVTYYFSCRNVL